MGAVWIFFETTNCLLLLKHCLTSFVKFDSLFSQLANEDESVENGTAAVRVKQRREALKLPPIDSSVASQLSVGRSTAKFPTKTSEEVGWRSSQLHCNLERYGRYTKLKTSFLGQMKWPPEAIDQFLNYILYLWTIILLQIFCFGTRFNP